MVKPVLASMRPIVLVEDEPKDVELIGEALRRSGMANEVEVCRDGVEALDRLRRGGAPEPCVVILDLKLPKLDGLAVLEAMRAAPDLRDIPVVVMTGSRREADVVRAYRLGANAYVVKPFGIPEFMEAVRDLGAFWGIVHLPPRVFDGGERPRLLS